MVRKAGLLLGLLMNAAYALPPDFVYLRDIDPTIIQDIRYHTYQNFIGRPVAGYAAAECILTREAATQLTALQHQLHKQHLGLKVYDCYRPTRAVDDFVKWSQDIKDQRMKSYYYPRVNKADFFKLNYVAYQSGHSRGSTVDITIVKEPNHNIDMGTHWDFLDQKSHTLSTEVSQTATHHRLYLRQLMQSYGFEPIAVEWWHFTLKEEPFPNTYYNFVIHRPGGIKTST